jgi:hypothetical protein
LLHAASAKAEATAIRMERVMFGLSDCFAIACRSG